MFPSKSFSDAGGRDVGGENDSPKNPSTRPFEDITTIDIGQVSL